MSEKVSLLISAGQALSLELSAQASSGSVPMAVSVLSDQPSPSVSVIARTGVALPARLVPPKAIVAKSTARTPATSRCGTRKAIPDPKVREVRGLISRSGRDMCGCPI
jgi:hypothetical protein